MYLLYIIPHLRSGLNVKTKRGFIKEKYLRFIYKPNNELKASLKGDVVTITLKTDEDVDKMKQAPNVVEINESGPKTLRIKVANADEDLPELINYISDNHLSTIKLTVQKPSLDEVFLEYTGRDIRVEEPGDARKMMMNMKRVRK